MANDMSDAVRDALGQVMRGALKNATQAASGKSPNLPTKSKSGPFSGLKGVAAGAGLAAAAPLALRNVDKLKGGIPKPSAGGLASKAGDQIGSKLKDSVGEKVDEAGGAGGMLKEAASGLLPGGGGGGGGKGGVPGVGKGRRMPVQQAVDVAVPIETAYNQWTQFEDWPTFMHRVTRVTQEDDCTVSFATKIWGKTKEFTAKIDTQRPDERIKWRVSQGITHTGVVTFHELAPRLTRIELNVDVDPGSLIEKAARGMRHVKRAMRADLHRFKAFIEVQELETGAWRGVIENGELVEPHDESYDEERDYSDIEDAIEQPEDSEEESSEEDEQEDEDREMGGDGEPMPARDRTGRFQREGQRSRSAASERGSSSRTADSSGRTRSGSRSSSGSSRSGNGNGASRGSSSRSSSSRSSSRSGNGNGSSSGSSRSRSSSSGSGSSSGSSRKRSSGSGSSSGSSRTRSSGSGSSSGSSRTRSSGSGSRSSSRSGNGSKGSSSSSRSGNGSGSSRRKASSRS